VSILTDDNTDTGISDSDAVAQLLASMNPSKGTPEGDDDGESDDEDLEDEDNPDADEDDETDPDDADDDGEGEDDEDGEADEKPAKPDPAEQTPVDVKDDTVVKVSVDGQDLEFTVGNLKRLAGQEASLTRKSQEADLVGGRAAAALEAALESVLEDLSAYEGIDWVLEGRRMGPEMFEWHRTNYTKLSGRYNKLVGSAQDFDKVATERRTNFDKEAAEGARKALTAEVEGWNDELDASVRKYAVSLGLAEDEVSRIVSAPVLKIIHKAMLHDRAATATAEKVKAAPTKVRKGAGEERIAPAARYQNRLEKQIASGVVSERDAAAALMGRWGFKG
jgi:hypothetical protein